MIHPIFSQWDMKNKRIFIRADLNIPLLNKKITNDFRLIKALDTINFILNHQGSIVLATHIGKPQTNDDDLSTRILIPWFKERGYTIEFIPDMTKIASLPITQKQILLLENLRFFPGEQNGDPFFAKQLANTAHYYINDAFGVIHRNDTSVTLLPYKFPEHQRSIGLLMAKELQSLDNITKNPERPFIAILGGKKIKDKIPLINHLLKKVDALLLCPALCFSFLKSLEKPIGKSLIDNTMIEICKNILSNAQHLNIPYLFPIDYQISYNTTDGPFFFIPADQFPQNAIGISIGPKTVDLFTKEINHVKTIFLNCAMGFEHTPETQKSTKDIINAMAMSSAKTIIAGGDSVNIALQTPYHEQINHLSTGGGAALAYLSGVLLPSLTAFEKI